jgi:hypothetical protein
MNRVHRGSAVSMVGLVVLLAASGARGAVFYVDDDAPNDPGPGDSTLSDPLEDGSADHPFDAITEAINAASPGMEVVLQPGTYSGPYNRDLSFFGKAITVRGADPDDPAVVAATVIDCGGTHAQPHFGFNFENGEGSDSVLAGLTITNGHRNSTGGAAINLKTGTSPTIIACRLTNNYCDLDGGAIRGFSSGARLLGCEIINNTAGRSGGGASVTESVNLEFRDCLIKGNSGGGTGGIDGTYGSVSMIGCTISENTARSSGGVCFADCLLTMADCTVTDNTATTASGAGIYFADLSGENDRSLIANCTIGGNIAVNDGGGLYATGPLTVTNCVFTGNSAHWGAAVYCYDSELELVNCLIAGNTTTNGGYGGAIFFTWYYSGGSLSIVNCTLTGNSAQYGGAIIANRDICHPTIINSILWGNSAPVGPEIGLFGGTTLTLRYSTVQGGTAAAYLADASTIDWGAGCMESDPVFVYPTAGNYRLRPGSPCIDSGDTTGVLADVADLDDDGDMTERVSIDLAGRGRFVDMPPAGGAGVADPLLPGMVDMGVYETFPTVIADLDDDGDVDADDLTVFETCASGPAVPHDGSLNCQDADADNDNDVDQSDFAILQRCYGGMNMPESPNCLL